MKARQAKMASQNSNVLMQSVNRLVSTKHVVRGMKHIYEKTYATAIGHVKLRVAIITVP